MTTSKNEYDRDFRATNPLGQYVTKAKAFPGALVVSRDPCFRCGVRADIGCAHQPARPASTIEKAIR